VNETRAAKSTHQQKLILLFILALIPCGAWGDFSCPQGTNAACLNSGEEVCPGSAKCVDADVVCFDKHSCNPGSDFICESEYDEVLNSYNEAVKQYNDLTLENVNLRERRLEQKNCVINASSLEDAIRCVR